MNKNYWFIILLLMLSLQACSSRQAYEAMQTRERNECLKVPESQYQECMERASQSYDEFNRDREKLEK
jgi:hypothetical protein